MTKAKADAPSYQTLKTELDSVLMELQREDIDVDQAIVHYERGLQLVRQLEAYLSHADNKVKELKAAFNASAS